MAGAVALQCHQYRRPTRCGRRHTGSNTFCLSFSAMRRYSAERDRQTERERVCLWAGKVSGELGSGRALKTMRPHLLPSPPIYYHLQERFIACVRASCFGLPVPLLSGNSVRFFPRRPHRSTSPHILPPWVVVMFPISSTNLSMPHKWKAPSKNGEALGTMLFPPKMHGCFAEFMHD